MYEYGFKLLRVIDGDTVELQLDLGFSVKLDLVTRLKGINTAEIHSKDPVERAAAQKAKGAVEAALTTALALKVQTDKLETDDKYGRFLATIFFQQAKNGPWIELNKSMIDNKLAKPYSGTGPKTW